MMIGDDEEFGPLPGDSQSLGDLHEVWLRRRQAIETVEGSFTYPWPGGMREAIK